MEEKAINLSHITTLWGKMKTYVAENASNPEVVLDSVFYEGVKSASNTSGAAAAHYTFAKIRADKYDKPCRIKFRVRIDYNDANTASSVDKTYATRLNDSVLTGEMTFNRALCPVYDFNNSFYSTSYYPVRYFNYAMPTNEDSYNAGNVILLGFYCYNGYLPTTMARDIRIEVLEIDGGTFELVDSWTNRGDCGYSTDTHTSANISVVNGNYHTGDQNTTYAINYLLDARSVRVAAGTTVYRYMIFGFDKNGYAVPLSITNNNQLATKKPCALGFDPSQPLQYYHYTTNYAANAVISTSYNYKVYSAATIKYSIQFTANLANYTPIYIKFTLGDDGLFYLPQPTAEVPYPVWHSTELPTEDDGYYYWFIGRIMTSDAAAGYQIAFNSFEQRIYKYSSILGKVVEWSPQIRAIEEMINKK